MARDRLAAMRAQRGQDSYTGAVPGQQPAQGGNAYEMAGMREPDRIAPASAGGAGGFSDFQQEVSTIEQMLADFNAGVQRISQLHGQSLNNMDPSANQQNQQALENQVEQTRQLSNELKQRINALEARSSSGQDARMQKNISSRLRKNFVASLQNYQKVEHEYRTKYKQRVERQFRIVKPDATAEEVKAVVDDTSGTGNQIFAQALSSSTRYNESRLAYREAQERHEEILRIEQNIAELAQLVNDMSVLVNQADEQIDNIQTTAAGVQDNMEAGVKQQDEAIVSARRARKMRWICFWLTVVLLIIVAIIVAVVVTQVVNKK
jgi:syntaxin 1B/2/3